MRFVVAISALLMSTASSAAEENKRIPLPSPLPVPSGLLSHEPNAQEIFAARDLLDAMDTHNDVETVGANLGKIVVARINGMFSDGLAPNEVQAQMNRALIDYKRSLKNGVGPDTIDKIARIYASHFTVAELRRLAEIHRDPAMKKFNAIKQGLLGAVTPVFVEALQPQTSALFATMQKAVKDWASAHPNDRTKLREPNAI